MHEGRSGPFVLAALTQFLVTTVFLLVQIGVFFVSADYSINPRSWFYFGTALIHYGISTIVQYRFNRELLVQRLKPGRAGSKRWDEILMRASNLTVILLIPAVAGLDYRFGWAPVHAAFGLVGLAFAAASTGLLNWAMVSNPFFEPTVRIQTERGHEVVTRGPYGLVRHPGYLAGILFALSIPFLIGSIMAFLAVGVYVALVVLRTWLEDETLQRELAGYPEYVRQVEYRLIPKIW